MIAGQLDRRRWRAPDEDGGRLVDPPLEHAARLVEAHRRQRSRCPAAVAGQPLTQFARAARRELLREALDYTARYRALPSALSQLAHGPPSPEALADLPLLVGGHQPALSHPGVWYKTFVLSALAHRQRAVAVHLLIDNDTLTRAVLNVPTGPPDAPRLLAVPLDQPGAPVAFEARPVIDAELFRSFGRRAASTIRSLVPAPLIDSWWPHVTAALDSTRNLGQCLAQARHCLESHWGLETLEVPWSRVCDTPSFRRFACHLLADPDRVRDRYNQRLADYRSLHRLRSHTHPARRLARNGHWLEAPFWIWTTQQPERRRLWVRRAARQRIELSDAAQLQIELTLADAASPEQAVAELDEHAARGLRLRPRALLTTLYARLVLADLFVHGIGGAKYDEVTDRLMADLFSVQPPGFLVATATCRLPVPRPGVEPGQLRQLDRQLRELRFHPERFLDAEQAIDPRAAELVEQKRRWIIEQPPADRRRERHEGIERANAGLQAWVQPLRERLWAERRRVAEQLPVQRVLAARDYAFCLYPEATLRDVLGGELQRAAAPL